MSPSTLEELLQAELDQPRRHCRLGEDAEVSRPKHRAWIRELRVVNGIIELYAERELCVFPDTSTVVVLPMERSVLNCPGPLMMLRAVFP